jgi:pimeloyl-ACP methyl ester carboxylesterase
MTTVLLIHGGLWEEGMDSERFWHQPGIVAGLQDHGFEVLAPSRLHQAPDWTTEASYLAPAMPGPPVTILAGSNGCPAAARLALDFPNAVTRLLLAWPATANDPAIDTQARAHLAGLGATPKVIDALLAGQTLRGLTDAELATLKMPVGVLPSVPANPFHQRHTVDALLRLLPRAEELPGCPEPPRPGFPPHLESFLGTIAAFTAR